MKISGIRIKNLASLEGETVINFTQEPLCSAGIFAITGVTGAGKSTILDALCLALYAQTPRFEKAKESGIEVTDIQGSTLRQNDPRSILRDGTADGYAEVVFEGIDGQTYLSRWSVRRARNKIEGALQADAVELRNLTSDTPYPGKKTETLKEIERLAGLNFEQFTRSVLLAQGDFTAFLKATKDEKASLLEKLTGTHIYSQISQLIFQRYRDSEKAVHELRVQKDTVELLSPEEISERETEQARLKKEVGSREQEKQALSNELQWHEQLKEFSASVNTAMANMETAGNNYERAGARFQKAALIEKVQGAAILVNAMQTATERLRDKQQELERNNIQLQELHQHKNTVNEKQLKAEEELEKAKIAMKEAEPLLKAAAELDVVLREKGNQVTEAVKQWKEATEAAKRIDTELRTGQNQELELEKNICDVREWQEGNSSRRSIAENRDVIVGRLQQASKTLGKIEEYEAGMDSERKRSDELLQRKTVLEEEVQKLETRVLDNKKQTEEKSAQISGVDAGEIQMKTEQQHSALHEILTAQNHWETQSREETALENLGIKVKDAEEGIEKNEELLIDLGTRLFESKLVKEAHEKLLQKARLEQSVNVEKLRETLLEGEPCAVCGSVHHPYAHGQWENGTLATIEREFRIAEEEYMDVLKHHTSVRENNEFLKTSLPKLNEEVDLKQKSVFEMQQKWESFTLFGKVSGLKKENIGDFLKSEEAGGRSNLHALGEKQERFGKIQKDVEQLKATGEKLSRELLGQQNVCKDVRREILSSSENLGRLEQLFAKEEAEITKAEEELNPFFPDARWFSNWKKKPEEFVNNIRAFAQKWKEKEEELRKAEKDAEVVKTRVSELKKQLQNYRDDSQKKKTIYEKMKEEQLAKEQERKGIFGGRPAPEVERELTERVERTEKEKEVCNKEMEELQNTLTVTQTQQKETEKAISSHSSEIESKRAAIEQWLSVNVREIEFADLLGLLEFTPEWRQKENRELQQISEAKKHAATVLHERQELLNNHQLKRKTEREERELQILLQEITGQNQQASARVNEISFILNRNREDLKKVEKLLKAIEEKQEIAENWSKLNEIIGSADGKKFRQIAQEYTLDILLEHANVELAALTKRYSLERIPATLALQVVDHDMGDEIRTVFSLSGGESFLLSLALALGLSSLSSAQMKVESLFIDEGFGALDPQTLNIAMDALERLHNQGRKVGVISHVQEMTERIPVQIKVQKVAAGRSIAEVVGG